MFDLQAFDYRTFLEQVSYIGILVILFAETGLLLGFFLPGDSLLILAGVLAASGKLSLPLVILFGCLGALLGNSLGYWIGERLGPRIFTRPKSRWFNPENVARAQSYFDRYGALTLIIARFVPFVRTFAATLAGVGRMNYWRFQLYNVIGGVLWCITVPTAGYFLGSLIPDLDRYILLVIALVVIAAFVPLGLALLRRRRRGRAGKQEPSHHP